MTIRTMAEVSNDIRMAGISLDGKKEYFAVYVEGGHNKDVSTLREAEALRKKYEKEGWNVKVLKMVPTIAGYMGVEV